MDSNNRNGSRAARAPGFMALCAMLAMGLGLMASRSEAAPFAYVTIPGICPFEESNDVAVFDTATNPPSRVADINTLGSCPGGSPSRRMGNTPTLRINAPAAFR